MKHFQTYKLYTSTLVLILFFLLLISCNTTNSITSSDNNQNIIEEDIEQLSNTIETEKTFNQNTEEQSQENQTTAESIQAENQDALSQEDKYYLKEDLDSSFQAGQDPSSAETEASQDNVSPPPAEDSIEAITANMSEEQKKFYIIKKTTDYEVIGADLDYKIMVRDDEKRVIIQFEETDSEEDWHNNYLFFPWPLKLDNRIVWTTYGYAKIYKSAENIPFNEFYKQILEHPDYEVVIWGWSLGSALAKITARHLMIRTSGQLVIDELTTFGDVKCWYNPFYSVKKHCKKIHEYVNDNDLITWCIPFCRRDVTCKVGERFSFKRSRYSEDYHTHYENHDYSKWEEK